MTHSKPLRRSRSVDRPKYLLPSEFDAEAIVGPLKADAARWLVSTVLGKAAANDVDARGFAILSSAILERVMGHGYARIVTALTRSSVLERSSYWEGRCRGYRLDEAYLAQNPRWMPVTNPVMLDRIKRERRRYRAEQAELRQPIHDALDASQQALGVESSIFAAVASLLPAARLCQRVHIDRIRRHTLPFSISSTRRVFNGISGVSRTLRPHVHLDGSPIGCIDICNSQPAILANILKGEFPHQRTKRCSNIKHPVPYAPLPPLLSCSPALAGGGGVAFASLAMSGRLYDVLAEACGGGRDFVKKRFLVDVLARKDTYPSEVEDVFRREFPEVWRVIQRANSDSHCYLIRLLQRWESWFVVENVSPRLVEDVPIVTLHDAIFGRVRDLGRIEEAFHETLDEMGWQLALKPEVAA